MHSKVISIFITQITFQNALSEIISLAVSRVSCFACFVNAHMVVEAWDSLSFNDDLKKARFRFADGMPIAKAMSLIHGKKQERIAGMDFLEPLLASMNSMKLRLFIFGGSQTMLEEAKKRIEIDYPEISLSGLLSPSFGEWSEAETTQYLDEIKAANPNIVMVILGCPKQEKFMARHYMEIPAPLLGLGGALPTFLNLQKRAPKWMQFLMLEWLYRLIQEPNRLWQRYFYTNLKFIWLFFTTFHQSRSTSAI